VEVLKIIAANHGFQLLAAGVHDSNHVHLFVSATPKTSIPVMVSVFKCVSDKLLFEEFPEFKTAALGWSFVVRGLCCENCWCCAKLENRRIHQSGLIVDAHPGRGE
jgi:REP element-mobilizing transposase RayT